jgi:hypothetical protein
LKKVTTRTSGPFPALIELGLRRVLSFDKTPIIPDSFLGGSSLRLRSLDLYRIPVPAIGKLLLSTRDLISLSLGFITIPPSGYLSPEAMVPILSALTRLESLHLKFHIPYSAHGVSQRPSELPRVVLAALTDFIFYGDSKWLGDFVSRIDAPLDSITVTLSEDLVVSDILLLRDFIDRNKILNGPHRAETSFSNIRDRISLFQRKGEVDFKVLCLETLSFNLTFGSQLSSFVQVCGSLLPPLPSLEYLSICKSDSEPLSSLHHEVVTLWMGLLRPFITVKYLVLDEPLILSVASTMQELVGEQGTEILPALQTIFLKGFQSSGPVPEGIMKFIVARGRSGRPVSVHH